MALPELPPVLDVQNQGAGDLGNRQEHVLRRALALTPRALAIGTDSPDLPRRLLDEAERTLLSHDAVLGPTLDGGYYLIGLRRCPEGLLGGLPWSVPQTGARTTQRLRDQGWDVALLEPWYDVDTAADLERLRGEVADRPHRAPVTAALVSELFGCAGDDEGVRR